MSHTKVRWVAQTATTLINEGKFSEAVEYVTPWAKSKPNNFDALFLLGAALLGLSRPKEALEYLLRAHNLDDRNSKLLNNLGSCYGSLRINDLAIQSYESAIRIDPKFSQAHYNLGNLYMRLNDWINAIKSLSNAIEYKNNYTEAYGNLSICLSNIKAYNDAINVCDVYINQHGLNPKIIINKCHAIFTSGMKVKAIDTLNDYIKQLPNSSELHTVIADLYMSTKQFESAIKHYSTSIELNPSEYVNYNNLGILLMDIKRYDEAIESFKKASNLNENSPIPHQNIASILSLKKDYSGALVHLLKAKDIDPNAEYLPGMIAHAKIYTCTWHGLSDDISKIVSDLTFNGKISNPFPPVAYIDDQFLLTKIATDWVNNKCPKGSFFPVITKKIKVDKIKLAYFSADFHSHATALLMAGMLKAHDRTKFELIAFSFGPDSNDNLTKNIRSNFDKFIDVRSLSDRAVAACARDLEIDISIDLKGFTQDSRTGIFAERTAPIQINYLGFPGSMGASYIDYIIADDFIIPRDQEHSYAEHVLRMPNCYQPNDNKRIYPRASQKRQDHNLPDDALVLCSFNNNFKITPNVFDIWMRLLNQFPSSVLWLLKDNQTSEYNLVQEAKIRGVSSERLIFAERLNQEDHLARHSCADLFLDTYPCNAHTTASDALWTGLPMVTCSGNSFASRVAGSLLNTIGLPELITYNLLDYERTIIELMSSPSFLSEIKSKLQKNIKTSPLFDTLRYTKDWEQLLINLHQKSLTN